MGLAIAAQDQPALPQNSQERVNASRLIGSTRKRKVIAQALLAKNNREAKAKSDTLKINMMR